MNDLLRLGWDHEWAALFGAYAEPGLVPGRVALEHNHVYRVLTEDGEWLAEASGRMKFEATGREALPAVGDWVAVRRLSSQERAVIRHILPRRSRFSRKAAGRGTSEQVIAANVDVVFVVVSLETPLKPRSLERYLILARQSGARPVVVLNKLDLAVDGPGAIADVAAVAPDVLVHAVSVLDGRGLEELNAYFTVGRTVALLGPSGAGKSSLLNRLVGSELLATGAVRTWDARGRHTSVHRQLVVLDRGGLVIDTPGMRELQLWDADEGVEQTFEDIVALSVGCRFRDCGHDSEPGCAVKQAVADDRLAGSRYESYLKLARERKVVEQQQVERALIDQKRQGQTKTPRKPEAGQSRPKRRTDNESE